MAKTRTEKIESYDVQIAKLQEQRKKEVEKQKADERKARDKRLRTRGEVLEKMLPETINLTAEQFTAFLNKTTANQFGRDKLAEMIKTNEAKAKSQDTPTPNGISTPPTAPSQLNENKN